MTTSFVILHKYKKKREIYKTEVKVPRQQETLPPSRDCQKKKKKKKKKTRSIVCLFVKIKKNNVTTKNFE